MGCQLTACGWQVLIASLSLYPGEDRVDTSLHQYYTGNAETKNQYRGVEQWQLVGLITQRSQVRVLPPLPLDDVVAWSMAAGAWGCPDPARSGDY